MCVFNKQNTANERRISDWSSDVCSSDLQVDVHRQEKKFDRHQDDDDVLAVQEDAEDPQGEEDRGDREIVSEADFQHGVTPRSGWGPASPRSTARGCARSAGRCSDRKSTRLTPVTNAILVCRILREKNN